MLSKILRGAVLATFAVGATVAQAGPFNGSNDNGWLKFEAVFDGKYATISPTHSPAYSGAATAGLMGGYFNNDGLSSPPSSNNNDDFFYFFCVDLGHIASSSYSGYTRSTNTELSAADIAQLENLFDRYVNSDTNDLGTIKNHPNVLATRSAAMQLAIWNIVYDYDLTVDAYSGALFSSAGDASSLANSMLSWVNTPLPSNQQYTYNFFRYNSNDADASPTNKSSQDYLAFQRNKIPRFDVPLPGTLALFGIGLAGLGLARRKS